MKEDTRIISGTCRHDGKWQIFSMLSVCLMSTYTPIHLGCDTHTVMCFSLRVFLSRCLSLRLSCSVSRGVSEDNINYVMRQKIRAQLVQARFILLTPTSRRQSAAQIFTHTNSGPVHTPAFAADDLSLRSIRLVGVSIRRVQTS